MVLFAMAFSTPLSAASLVEDPMPDSAGLALNRGRGICFAHPQPRMKNELLFHRDSNLRVMSHAPLHLRLQLNEVFFKHTARRGSMALAECGRHADHLSHHAAGAHHAH